MVKLIVSDIDGTLLNYGEKEISPAVFQEIKRLKRKGILFCPASGRQYSSLRRLFTPVENDLYYLCENGAVVYSPGETGSILSKTEIPREIAFRVCHDILNAGDCEICISGANTSYIIPKNPSFYTIVHDIVGNNTTIVSCPEEVPEAIIKISAYCKSNLQELYNRLSPAYENTLACAIAGIEWLDFTLADKGTGLAALCRAIGIDPSEVMAFGDNFNDVAILKLAGYPYLMINAPQALRNEFPTQCSSVLEILQAL